MNIYPDQLNEQSECKFQIRCNFSQKILGGAHPAFYMVDTEGSFFRSKWPGPVADLSPLSSTEVKNVWNYTSMPSDIFVVW
jgi:hypothetical protein